MKKHALWFLCISMFSSVGFADGNQTALLQPQEGFSGDIYNASVEEVKQLNYGEESVVEVVVSLPELDVEPQDVQVMNAENKPVNVKKIEVVKDYDKGRTGIILHLNKKMPFYLNFQSAEE